MDFSLPGSSLQAPSGQERQPCPPALAADEECQQIVPHTEVVDLKAQLQMMENLISSSQETIKVLLGVIQELEKGEAHREGYVCSRRSYSARCRLTTLWGGALPAPKAQTPK